MNETVLITGDAGAIGSAVSSMILESGRSVLGLDLANRDLTDEDGHLTLLVDVSDENAVDEALSELDRMPPLAHVVAVAGGALAREPTTQDDPRAVDVEMFRASLDRNLTSQFITLRAALPWLRSNAGAERSIVLTSSFNAISPQGMPAYSAAKAGLIGLMNALVRPLGSEGIRINTVAPGTIRTPRTESIWAHEPDHFDRLGSSAALGRVGSPGDVARVCRALVSDLTHVTGQVIVVDGGQTIASSPLN